MVGILISIFKGEEFIYGTFDDCIDLCNFAIPQSLLDKNPVNGNSPKVSGYLFVFLYLVLMLVVADVNLVHTHISIYPKNDYWCGLSYQKTVRFAASVDVMLEDYNNCLQNNKYLGVKHVLIVFG